MGFLAKAYTNPTVTTSETTLVAETDVDGVYQVEIDAAALVAGDTLEIKMYQQFDTSDVATRIQVGDTIYMSGPRVATDIIGVFDMRDKFKITGKMLSATSRVIRCVLKPVA